MIVGPGDSGKTITVVEGQTLIFASAPEDNNLVQYRLVSFPAFLTPKSDPAKLPYEFLVLFAGVGDLMVTQGPACSSGSAAQCALLGPSGAPGGMPIRQYTITIKAQGQGL